MQELVSQTPLLLVLEDLHWADDLSLRLVSFVARRATKWPLTIVLTARQEELTPSGPIRRVIDELGQRDSSLQFVLPALDRADTGRLVTILTRSRLGPSRTPILVDQVWSFSNGN